MKTYLEEHCNGGSGTAIEKLDVEDLKLLQPVQADEQLVS
jgi:hypothetical protein